MRQAIREPTDKQKVGFFMLNYIKVRNRYMIYI
jgi:hypothetical protein